MIAEVMIRRLTDHRPVLCLRDAGLSPDQVGSYLAGPGKCLMRLFTVGEKILCQPFFFSGW